MAMDATTCWCSMRASPRPGTLGGGCRSTRGRTTASSGLTLDLDDRFTQRGSWDNTQVLDLDGDGALDLVNVGTDGRLRAFQRLGGVPDQLIGIGNGSSRGRTEISYTTLADRNVHTPGTCDYPQTCPISGGSVVAEHSVISDFGTGTEPTWDRYRHTIRGGARRPARPGLARVRQAHRHPVGHRRHHGDRVRQRDP